MSQQASIGGRFIILPTIGSSNNYAMEQIYDGKAVHGDCFLALKQTGGKGQRGKVWNGGEGNLALSIVLSADFLNLHQGFLLQTLIATTVRQVLNRKKDGFFIKWPNDIYFNDRKAAGILIENIVSGHKWKHTVVGIGINVNDINISKHVPTAISLAEIIQKEFDIISLAFQLTKRLEKNWQKFKQKPDCFVSIYNKSLYKKGETVTLKKNQVVFKTIIHGVDEGGLLICGEHKEYEFTHGEVEWIG
jgi:BirA family transcriptional regulator, biotin operon repressor / biotin---[acetyl-CoA-carboxylase] ligase